MVEQDPPFALQYEPVEGCDLACKACGIQAIRENGADLFRGHGKNSGPFKHMTVETAERIASEIKRLDWNPRIEAAMHGEPTLNKSLPQIVEAFRRRLPRAYLMVTTNGGGLMKGPMVQDLFDAGLNTLAIDLYQHAGREPRLRAMYGDFKGAQVIEYPANLEGNPHQRHRGKKLVFVQDIFSATKGTHSHISNHALNSGPPDPSYAKKRCAKPFREIAIRWDGNVAICCVDWTGVYKIGNVNEVPLDEIWNHKRFQAARRVLMHEGRSIIPCLGCNEAVTRPGLLPDKFGKVELMPPTEATYRKVEEALAGPAYSKRVKEIYR